VVNVPVKYVQLDECWEFFRMKQKTKERLGRDDGGDIWTWLAIDADSKLILSHACGDRSEGTCIPFL
jgi:hypothetical protein